MGIGILRAARYSRGSLLRKRTPASVLDDVERWWRRHAADLDPVIERTEAPDVFETTIALHPAAEGVAFEVTEPGTLVVSATTSLVGPDYHRYLVDGLRRMAGEIGLDWVDPRATEELGDETGYFETGDSAAVDAEMLAFGRGLGEAILEAARDGVAGIEIGMPAVDVRYPADDFVQTVTGPRDRDAVVRIAAGDEEDIRALNPWWADPLDGAFHLGRALARMWCDVAWVGPVEDDERPVLEAIDADLAAADRGGRETPASEWNEVRALLGDPRRDPAPPRQERPSATGVAWPG